MWRCDGLDCGFLFDQALLAARNENDLFEGALAGEGLGGI